MSTPACPVCGTGRAREIVYGLVIADVLDDPDVEIGGCVIVPDAPAFACRNPACGARFGSTAD